MYIFNLKNSVALALCHIVVCATGNNMACHLAIPSKRSCNLLSFICFKNWIKNWTICTLKFGSQAMLDA